MIERLVRSPIGLAGVVLAALFLLTSTVSFVPETRQGVVVQLRRTDADHQRLQARQGLWKRWRWHLRAHTICGTS